MTAEAYCAYAAKRAHQLSIDAVHAKRVGRDDIAAMLRAAAQVYIGNARFAARKVN